MQRQMHSVTKLRKRTAASPPTGDALHTADHQHQTNKKL
jgi:hypothetical protein